MLVKLIKLQDQICSTWAGGSTTQLFIYPEQSTFSERNFDFRISSAKVDVPQSDFTPLPGFDRILLLLGGELEVFHKGHYSKILTPFKQDNFSGSWETRSVGCATDFNLIMKEGLKGELTHLAMVDSALHCQSTSSAKMIGYFLYRGTLLFESEDHSFQLLEGEMIVLENLHSKDNWKLTGNAEIIRWEVLW